MPTGDTGGKITIIVAALIIISAFGVTTYYDEFGNVLVSNDTVTVITDNTTKVIDYSKPNENTTTKVVYEGDKIISSVLTAKAAEQSKTELTTYEKAVVLAQETDKTISAEKFPLDISPKEPEKSVVIEKYRCKEELCGYWISCLRDGKEVSTNSPIWISPPPYEVLVSESFDSAKNEQTVTLKEDPKLAGAQVLQSYCDRQPIGKAVVGTKE